VLTKQYKDKEIDKIIKSIVILVDSREQVWSHIKLWLRSNKISFEIYKLDFGDYSFMIPKNEKLEIPEDIYFNNEIAIERKANAEEISGNLTNGRDRFKREFERGNAKIRLLIEDSSYADITNGNYDTDFNSNSFVGSLHSIQEEFNTPFFFTDKEHSGQYIYNSFKYYIRNKLKIK
jgi:ERCC4-type nuclease